MHSNYNINQLSLNMATFYEPEKNHQAHYIHHLVESIDFDDSYTFGRPFLYTINKKGHQNPPDAL
ncbi:hypothetical protein FMM69_01780 [Lactobacillus murinus]|uniref:hypothetical protein n=1 Tax=Ligilactobacillus murinus TaxID=1622 RepID=UPI00139EC69C|nr:hypothetical protein [Ligilactobacillus murinus]NDO24994.1 hypothetical protein [Ligilactobacillus murinus]